MPPPSVLQRQALTLASLVGDRQNEGINHLRLGKIALDQGEARAAVAELDAIAILRPLHSPASEAKSCHTLMRAWAALGQSRLRSSGANQPFRTIRHCATTSAPGVRAEAGFVHSTPTPTAA